MKRIMALAAFIPFSLLNAAAIPKQAILNNYKMIYQKQKSVDSFSDMFQEGNVYGRIRSNSFYFAYTAPDNSHDSQPVSGLGVSFVYKSALYKGFEFEAGVHSSYAFFHVSDVDAYTLLKPGKDVISPYDYVKTGSKWLNVLSQANISYTYSQTDLRVGRQLVETFYTKSNDSKMVPNTFDGAVIVTKDIPHTKITFAYLAKQKLRNHTQSHSVLMYDDSNVSDFSFLTGNDDAVMHYGFSKSNLEQNGKSTNAPLIVLDVHNTSVANLKADYAAYVIPSLLSQAMGEINYKIDLGDFSLTPGVRYIQQFDNGSGKFATASLYPSLGLQGYKNPYSLDAKMIAARLVGRMRDYRLNLACTYVLDEADIVAPWRGFPTAGYTRSMGIYNWRSNTKSYRIELVKGANRTGVYKSPFMQASILYIDGDERKSLSKAKDSLYYYAGMIQNIPSLPELQYRLRVGYRDFTGTYRELSSYVDARFELNYLF